MSMKKIFVPTDFSKCANAAFEVACSLATLYKSSIELFHTLDLPEGWNNLSLEEKVENRTENATVIEARQNLMELQERARSLDIDCSIQFATGKFIKELQNHQEGNSIDLIVMGSHGISGKEEWFIGSNTQKAVRKLDANIFVVKETLDLHSVKKAAFVSGLHEADKSAFTSFLEFIKPLQPEEVHVLSIDTSSWFNQPTIIMEEALRDFKKLAQGFNCTTHFYRDFSIQSGIRHFVEENQIDLIGISNITKHPIKRIFLGSNVEILVNHAKAPVLVIGK